MRPPAGACLAILDALRDGPLCVSAVVKATGLSQSNVSNHLGRLRSVGWVSGDREGRHQLQFLRNNRNPCGDCFARRREAALYSADGERSFVTDQSTTQ